MEIQDRLRQFVSAFRVTQHEEALHLSEFPR
jgi:hypothetical protein